MEISKIRLYGILILVVSVVLSEIIANMPTENEAGLHGVSQLFAPILIGAISILIFIGVSFLIKSKFFLWLVVAIASIYIVYVGLDLHYKY